MAVHQFQRPSLCFVCIRVCFLFLLRRLCRRVLKEPNANLGVTRTVDFVVEAQLFFNLSLSVWTSDLKVNGCSGVLELY